MRRFSLFFLVFTLLFSSIALGDDYASDYESVDVMELDLEGNPRYTYLGFMTIGLDIDANGYLTYSGTARTNGYDLRITLTLQKSTNDVFWDDMECYVKTGYNLVSAGGSRYLAEEDCFYRAKIVTEVFDSNRNVIETATGYSDSERY